MYSPALLHQLACRDRMVTTTTGMQLNFLLNDHQPGLPDLLCVHGLGQNALVWARLLQACNGKYNCWAIDLPGHGASDALPEAPTIAIMAEAVLAGISALDLRALRVIGHSMGGQISTRLALDDASRLDRLLLLAPGGYEFFTPKEALRIEMTYSPWLLKKINLERFTAQVKEGFAKYPADFDPILHFLQDIRRSEAAYATYCKTLSQCMRAIMQEPLLAEAAQLSVPLKVVWAAKDRTIPNPILHADLDFPAFFQQMQSALPRAEVIAQPGVGHNLQWEGAEVIVGEYL